MKKRILFIIMAVLTFVVVLSACGGKKNSDTNTNTNTGEQPVTCEHNWESQSTTASCTTAGKETFKCSLCQETKEEDAAALGHDMQFVDTVKATCQEGGYDNYACTRCTATEKRHETEPSYAPDAHDFVDAGQAPTCTTAGYKDEVCSRCSASAGARVPLPALGHSYQRDGFDGTTGVSRVEPTCEENGSITYTCTVESCGETLTKTYEDLTGADATDADKALAATLAAINHNFAEKDDASNVKEKVAPTCTTPGYIVHTCQNGCGEEKKTVAGYEALTHTYERNTDESTWTYAIETAPTCVTKGFEWVVCTAEGCGHNTKDDEAANPAKYGRDVEPTGAHVYDANPVVTAPTCTTGGYTTYTCSVDAACGRTEQRDQTLAAGHKFEHDPEFLNQQGQPYCKSEGNWVSECTVCHVHENNVLEGDIPLANVKHEGYTAGDFSHAQSVAPTCVSRGKYYCSGCQTVFNAYEDDTSADATNAHTYTKKGDVVPSTCSVYGYTIYHCSGDDACQETEHKDYTALATHDYCDPSEDGTTTCFDCGKSFRDVTTDIERKENVLCTCGKGTEDVPCTECPLKVEFIATKVPDAAFNLTANTEFSKNDFNEGCAPALLVFKGEEGTTYEITVYDAENNAITTYNVVVDGKTVDTLNVATSASGAVAYVNLTEVAGSIAKVTVKASTDATVQMYCAIN